MPSLDDLEKLAGTHLAPLVDSGRVKSLTVAVTAKELTWLGAFGDVDVDGILEIGSITKTFTATAFAALVLEGRIAFDDPVERHLPEGVSLPTFPGSRPITLLDLATHTSGLPRLPSNLLEGDFDPRTPYAHYTEEQLLAALPVSELDAPAGEKVSYSNYGFGLLGYCLARVAEKDFLLLVEEIVCHSLDLNETSFVVPPELESRRVQGHDQAGESVPHWHTAPAMAGCGGLNSTIADMAKYLSANLSPGENGLDLAIESTQNPRVRVSDRRSVGIAWHISHRGGPHYIWHNGGTGGFGSMIIFERNSSTGACVLSNSYHQPELDENTLRLVAELANGGD